MTQILGIIQLVLIVTIVIYEYSIKSVSVFMWATLLVMFGIMHFITTFSANYQYSNEVLNQASLFVIGFCILYIVTRVLFNQNKKATTVNIKNIEIKGKNNTRLVKIFYYVILLCVMYKIITLAKSSGGLLNTSWGSGREMAEDRSYFSISQIITTLYYPSAGISLVLLCTKQYKKAFIIIASICINVIITRNRIEVLPIMACIISLFIFNNKKLNIKKIIVLIIVGMMSIYCIYGLRVFRHYGTLTNFIQEFNINEFNEKVVEQVVTGDGELGLREHFYYFIQNNNDFKDFNKGNTYKRMLFVLLPTRWSFGLKPPDFAISMGTAINPNIPGYSTHPTLFGDCYANMNMYGIVLGIFWALFVKIADIIIDRNNKIIQTILIVTFATTYIIIGRGSVYNAFVWNVYGLILTYIIYIISKCRLKVT